MTNSLRRVRSLLCLVVAALLSLSACQHGERISKANVDLVTDGMSRKQVESILGPPTSIDSKDFVLMKKTTYTYNQGQDSITIVFKDDKVQSKDSTLRE